MARERRVEESILAAVRGLGEATADEVAGVLGVSRPAVARHLPGLVARGVLQVRRETLKRGAPRLVYVANVTEIAAGEGNVTEIGEPNVTEIPEGNVTEIPGDLAWRVAAMRWRIPASGAIPFLKARDGTGTDGCLSCGGPLSPGYLASCDLCVSLAPSRRKPTGRRDTWRWRCSVSDKTWQNVHKKRAIQITRSLCGITRERWSYRRLFARTREKQ
jgi:DNA-binding transcriptional ArsR family regulator